MKAKDDGGIVEKSKLAFVSSPHDAEIFIPVQKAFEDFGKALSQIIPPMATIGTVAMKIASDHQLQQTIQKMRLSIERVLQDQDDEFLVLGFQTGMNESIKARWAYQRYIWGTPIRLVQKLIHILKDEADETDEA